MTESKLGRLFMYSKHDQNAALENFTTEALAQAISEDPAPFLRALKRAHGLIDLRPAGGQVVKVIPTTQVSLGRSGVLDLRLELLNLQLRRLAELWIEVKVRAALSPGQLEKYYEAAMASPRDPRPQVVLLSTWWQNERFPWVPWQSVASAARAGAGDTRWLDFGLFLEEEHVANDGALPIEDVEAASLEPAIHLFNKVNETLTIVHEWMYGRFPEYRARLTWEKKSGVVNTSSMLNNVAANFARRRGWCAQGILIEAIQFGATTEGGSSYWIVSVSVPSKETAGSLLKAAERLPDEWERSSDRPQALRKVVRVADCRESEIATTWFSGAFEELAASGLLAWIVGDAPMTVGPELDDRPGLEPSL